MWPLLRSARYLPRYRRIVAVLTRHGLGWLADQSGLSRFLTWPRRLLRRTRAVEPLPTSAERLRRALEELGPGFILLGRYLGTRLDLLPPALCRGLLELPAGGPAMPQEEVTAILEEAFGQPLSTVLVGLDPQPLWNTWLEQVHQARTPEGAAVWVAVPNVVVRALLEQERPMLVEMARLIEEGRPAGRPWPALEVLQGFDQALRQETDARERGQHLERWRRLLGEKEEVFFPEVDWARSTATVLTCRALPGRPLAGTAEVGRCREAVRALYRFFAAAMFEAGLYPAPPELGRPLLLEDGRLALSVFAPVGLLDPGLRRALLRLLERFGEEEPAQVIEAGIFLGLLERRQVSAAVHQAVRHLIERYHGLPWHEVRLAEVGADLFALAGRGLLHLQEDLALLLRTLVALEALGARVAPAVSLAEEMGPAVVRAIAGLHSWGSRQERMLRAGRAYLEALREFPVDLDQLLSQATAGELLLGVEPRRWQQPMRRLERMAHRLVLSVVAAGLLIGLALLTTALLPASWGPWGWLLAGGAMLALVVLVALFVLSFLPRGR